MPVKDPTQRFSTRTDNYVRYRPTYPPEVIQLLRNECGLTADSIVADIASGTGIFTRLLLENGNRVYGVEPNAEMRRAGEQFLIDYPNFTSVDGTAEATTLPAHSVDIVTAAQAAHWFKLTETRREFVRILKPAGWAVLIWNERDVASNALLREYEQMLLTYSIDYKEVRHERTSAVIDTFFAPSPFQSRVFSISQRLDYEGLLGRTFSASYTPPPGHPNHEPMLRELQRIFDAHQSAGKVSLDYATRVYYARLS
jgi:ubiquinone/menaquinone biosynthesis C-methylase UbiE